MERERLTMDLSRSVAYTRQTMSLSSVKNSITGFWEFFWVYAETHVGVYRATTAVAAMFGLLMPFDPRFAIPAVVTYFLPPMYLYLTGDELEDGRVPRMEDHDDNTDFDGGDSDADGTDADSDGPDADVDGADADADGIDVDADGIDIDSDGDAFDADAGSDADADADGADVDIDN